MITKDVITLKFINAHEQPIGKITFQKLDNKMIDLLTNKYNITAHSNPSPFHWIADSIMQMKSVGGITGFYNSYPKFSIVIYKDKKYLVQNFANGQQIIGIEKIKEVD